tara:strand:+ start:177 stop:902 length:726 start_codon:yes stop_codon:yes gene_type:complete
MFSADFIFISITLIILSTIALQLRVRLVIAPLVIIYLVVIISKVSKLEIRKFSENKIEATKTLKNSAIQNKDTLIIEEISIEDDLKENIQIQTSNLPTITKKTINEVLPTVEKKEQRKSIKKIKEKTSINNLINVKEIKICRLIKERSPVEIGEVFPSSIDSLYCYTKIENRGAKTEVRHIWYYENQIMTQVRYNVKKANVYRSWTKKTISSYQIGNWRVEVQDRNGTIIGSKTFRIKKPS